MKVGQIEAPLWRRQQVVVVHVADYPDDLIRGRVGLEPLADRVLARPVEAGEALVHQCRVTVQIAIP